MAGPVRGALQWTYTERNEEMRNLLKAKHHRVTERRFGPDRVRTLEGTFGPYSLANKTDRKALAMIAQRINLELAKVR